MSNPGHALRYTKGNEEKNIKPRPVLPVREDVPILRRAAMGYIVVTMIDGSPQYNYEDGTPVTLHRFRTGTAYDDGQKHFQRMVSEGWLIGDKGDSLFADDPQPQIYRARKP
jgi:hypothetical protein